jgi:hypothetical protein
MSVRGRRLGPARRARRPPDAVFAALALFDAVNRDDRAAQLRLVADDVSLRSAAAYGTGVRELDTGLECIRRCWRQFDAPGMRPRVTVLEARRVDGRALCKITLTRERAAGRLNIATTLWSVVAVGPDGKITSYASFRTFDEALRLLDEHAPPGRAASR